MKELNRNMRLGIFVLAGTVFLLLALYLIGRKQDLFGSTFKLRAEFYNINGLNTGNNVRFAGIDVGTVESIEIVSDTSVRVTMVIRNDVIEFIKKNAIASIGTDGLMGNKLVNINNGVDTAPSVKEGDILLTQRPLEMDEMIRTLNITNNNVKEISSNLKSITERLNNKNSLWSILTDTLIAEDIKASVANLKLLSNNAVIATGDIKKITADLRHGKGIGALITDTIISSQLKQSVVKINRISDTAVVIEGEINSILTDLRNGKGTFAMLVNDTSFVSDLKKSMSSLEKGTGSFDENMKALQYSWPFKKYFRKRKNK